MATSLVTKSLGALAKLPDLSANKEELLSFLMSADSESRYLEWKLTPPIGKNVTMRTKYRVVKAILSFANTDGGFVVFGVDPSGKWVGFERRELIECDPAKLAELINSCSTPDIGLLSYIELVRDGRIYPVVHVPPSNWTPHVTTKEVIDVDQQTRKKEMLLQKHAVYCRYVAKSDLATAAQLERIIQTRTDMLKSEFIRRARAIDVPVLVPTAATRRVTKGTPAGTLIKIVKVTDDPYAPSVRVTRDPSQASGILVQEELSAEIFKEIDHVLEANKLLANGRNEFVLGPEIYFRIYAEREIVSADAPTALMLARTALQRFYAPMLFWFTKIPTADVATMLEDFASHPKHPQINGLIRIAIILGDDAVAWLKDKFAKVWKNHPQPPEYVFALNKMSSKATREGFVRAALRSVADTTSPSNVNTFPAPTKLIGSGDASKELTRACLAVSEGQKDIRSLARAYDLVVYAEAVRNRASEIVAHLKAASSGGRQAI